MMHISFVILVHSARIIRGHFPYYLIDLVGKISEMSLNSQMVFTNQSTLSFINKMLVISFRFSVMPWNFLLAFWTYNSIFMYFIHRH